MASDAKTGFVRNADGSWSWLLSGVCQLSFQSAEIALQPIWAPGSVSILATLSGAAYIEWFYLQSDGTDWAPALQRAANYAASTGKKLILGARQYTLLTPVTLTSAITVEGQGFQYSTMPSTGTWLIIGGAGFNPFTISGQAARGTVFKRMAVYQSHPGSGTANWAPSVYPFVWTVANTYGEVVFEDIYLCAIYQGIITVNAGRVRFERITGQPFLRGIVVDQAYDICRFTGIHFWTYWSSAASVINWQQANGAGIELQRCDGPDLAEGTFIFGYKDGLLLSSSSNGVTTMLTGHLVTDCCRNGLHISGENASVQLSTLYCTGEAIDSSTLPDSNALLIESNSVTGQIGAIKAYQQGQSALRITATDFACNIAIGSLMCVRVNDGNTGQPAIFAALVPTGAPHQVSLSTPVSMTNCNGAPVINSNTDAILYTPNTNYFSPQVASGQTYQVPNYDIYLLLYTGGSTAMDSFTVTLSGNPTDGTINTIASDVDVTSLSLQASQTIINPVSSLKAGVGVTYKFMAPRNAWFRIG